MAKTIFLSVCRSLSRPSLTAILVINVGLFVCLSMFVHSADMLQLGWPAFPEGKAAGEKIIVNTHFASPNIHRRHPMLHLSRHLPNEIHSPVRMYLHCTSCACGHHLRFIVPSYDQQIKKRTTETIYNDYFGVFTSRSITRASVPTRWFKYTAAFLTASRQAGSSE